ncbi:hypothetical protein [Methanoculleus chikugoensis]|nr:hypothetical protein [Methanoculleus chikugoensis]
MLWTALHDFGFAETFEGGMVAIALVYFFTLLGTAGGGCRRGCATEF